MCYMIDSVSYISVFYNPSFALSSRPEQQGERRLEPLVGEATQRQQQPTAQGSQGQCPAQRPLGGRGRPLGASLQAARVAGGDPHHLDALELARQRGQHGQRSRF